MADAVSSEGLRCRASGQVEQALNLSCPEAARVTLLHPRLLGPIVSPPNSGLRQRTLDPGRYAAYQPAPSSSGRLPGLLPALRAARLSPTRALWSIEGVVTLGDSQPAIPNSICRTRAGCTNGAKQTRIIGSYEINLFASLGYSGR